MSEIEAPAPDVSTMTNPAPVTYAEVADLRVTIAAQAARITALEASEATLMQRVQEVEQQHSAMQQALDAERSARPATLEEVLAHIEAVFLGALATHAALQVADAPPEAPAPSPIARGIARE